MGAAGLLCLAYSDDHFQGYIPGYTCLALSGNLIFMSVCTVVHDEIWYEGIMVMRIH